MKPLYITAGHQILRSTGTGAHGIKEANGKQFDEGVEARKLANDIINHQIRWYGGHIKTDSDTDSLATVISKQKTWMQAYPDGVAMDIHFNAASQAATGVEVYIPTQYSQDELTLATALVNGLSDVQGLKRRSGSLKNFPGVKMEHESQHTSIGILRQPYKLTSVLIEVCFCTNPIDVQRYRSNYWDLVKRLSDEIGNFRNNYKPFV